MVDREAPAELTAIWKNTKFWSRSGKRYGFVREVFIRGRRDNVHKARHKFPIGEDVVWLVIRWADKPKLTTPLSLREGNFERKHPDDGSYQICK